jgi:hypothetical protein
VFECELTNLLLRNTETVKAVNPHRSIAMVTALTSRNLCKRKFQMLYERFQIGLAS